MSKSRAVKEYIFLVLISGLIGSLFLVFCVTVKPEILADLYFESFTTPQTRFNNRDLDYSVSFNANRIEPIQLRVNTRDFREIVFKEFFAMNESPLLGYERYFVNACKVYGAPEDCTVVIAIAKVETDLCKYLPSQDQKNCWGFGGSGPNRYNFNNYIAGINLVTSRLVFGYGKIYMINPNAMEMTYCGPRESCRTWGEKVQSVMNQLNNLSIQMGYGSLFDLRTS